MNPVDQTLSVICQFILFQVFIWMCLKPNDTKSPTIASFIIHLPFPSELFIYFINILYYANLLFVFVLKMCIRLDDSPLQTNLFMGRDKVTWTWICQSNNFSCYHHSKIYGTSKHTALHRKCVFREGHTFLDNDILLLVQCSFTSVHNHTGF